MGRARRSQRSTGGQRAGMLMVATRCVASCLAPFSSTLQISLGARGRSARAISTRRINTLTALCTDRHKGHQDSSSSPVELVVLWVSVVSVQRPAVHLGCFRCRRGTLLPDTLRYACSNMDHACTGKDSAAWRLHARRADTIRPKPSAGARGVAAAAVRRSRRLPTARLRGWRRGSSHYKLQACAASSAI